MEKVGSCSEQGSPAEGVLGNYSGCGPDQGWGQGERSAGRGARYVPFGETVQIGCLTDYADFMCCSHRQLPYRLVSREASPDEYILRLTTRPPRSTSSVAETKARVTETLLSVAHSYDLEFVAFNQTQKACKHRKGKGPYRGKMRLEVGNENPAGLEPAPITPSDGESFQLMGATIKKIFGDDVVVAPSAVSRL